jgi:hypothetical protein
MAVVTAARSFTYDGRALTAGTVLDMRPLDAAVLARRGDVYLRGDLTAAPAPPLPRVKRAYRRRNLTADV